MFKIVRFGTVVYYETSFSKRERVADFERKKKGKTTFSKESRARLNKVLDKIKWIESSYNLKGYSFLTLTIPKPNLSDKENKVLLKELLRKAEPFFYVWKAEKQKRGAIHFHVIVQTLKESELKKKWYALLKRSNQLGKIKSLANANYILDSKLIVKADLGLFFYMSKVSNIEVSGASWGSSDNLKYDEFREIVNTVDEVGTKEYEIKDEKNRTRGLVLVHENGSNEKVKDYHKRKSFEFVYLSKEQRIFIKAWTRAKEGSTFFGGNAKQYLGESLKQIYDEININNNNLNVLE